MLGNTNGIEGSVLNTKKDRSLNIKKNYSQYNYTNIQTLNTRGYFTNETYS